MIFDSIVNRNEYFSNHYLDALIHHDLAGLRKRWDEAEARGEDTARSRVRALSRDFFAAKTRVAEAGPADWAEALLALHDAVLAALGFPPDRQDLVLVRGGDEEVTVTAAHACRTHTGLLLLALDLDFAATVDEALDAEQAGVLLCPVLAGNGRRPLADPADAVAYVFATEEPPRYVLLLAGGVVLLADRAKWAEGRFLAIDLDLALGRKDTRSKGELETIAALFSADALVPVEDRSVLEQLAESSQKHAVGVSKDLREGIRQSVEILANEVIQQRLARNLRVYSVPGLAANLTKQSLRFLYRLLFLLYAEARPELGILPLDHPEYAEGYGLDRLRDLALTSLTEDKARSGRHLHESLKLLFKLVNDGYHHEHAEQAILHDGGSSDVGLRFEPLKSELFAPAVTPLLDEVPLRNEALQRCFACCCCPKSSGAGTAASCRTRSSASTSSAPSTRG